MNLIQGEAVTVIRTGRVLDELGEPTYGEDAREDLDASRPEGVTVAYTLCFPKTYAGELKGCAVEVRGERFRVVGDPQRYTEANTPGTWNLTVEVTRTDG